VRNLQRDNGWNLMEATGVGLGAGELWNCAGQLELGPGTRKREVVYAGGRRALRQQHHMEAAGR